MNEPPSSIPPTASDPAAALGAAAAGGRWELTREALDGLLDALAADRAEAGRKYVEIRERLVRMFTWRGCDAPDELADETINRVAHKLAAGIEIRSDDPFRYFCGVAFLVFKEVLRRQARERSALVQVGRQPPPAPEADDRRLDCLRRCLDELEPEHRRLVLDYHGGQGGERVRARRRLAARLAVPMNALRIRVHRVRARLEACVGECLEITREH
jgi:DNA-directed RNA polymerase specialized sigma24 family protein